MITTKIEKFENYGKVLSIKDGVCEVKVTLDLGPRMVYCGLTGRENVFFCDLERRTNCKKEEMEKYYGEGRFWYLYGGYRLWMAPEYLPVTYYPDNDPVQYVIKGDTVTFIPPVQKEHELQMLFGVTLRGDGRITVNNRLINFSKKKKTGSAWTLCAMAKDSYTFGLQSVTDTGLLPNRTLVLWPYTKLRDRRITLTDRLVSVRQDPDSKSALKIGFNNEAGKIATLTKDGTLFVQRYKTDHDKEKYPDGGCSAEIYSCPDFTEAEALSPCQTVMPGHSLDFSLEWELSAVDCPDRDVKTLEKLIRNA
ncbi:MAG: hypothetical protein J5879_02965 [Clostridia bacterium]|nr:hypothetical protein [Clostridia bacterium]